jgi:DNA-binding winged helix-turn-helix (wHTH) protein
VTTETELHFDGWTINRVSGETLRDGRSSRLPQQQLRMLIELHERAGEVVSREHLVKTLWPKGVVDFDNGLNVAMRKLRVALDDVGDEPRYIETIPKAGYRFIAHRTQPIGAADPPRPRRGSRLALVATLGGLLAAIAVGWWLGRGDPGHAASASSTPDARPRHVPSVRAQEFYLEGLNHRNRRDINGNPLARAAFQSAIQEDPN